jgi:hypothetical protein
MYSVSLLYVLTSLSAEKADPLCYASCISEAEHPTTLQNESNVIYIFIPSITLVDIIGLRIWIL